MSWLLQAVPQWTLGCRDLCELCFCLDVYTGVGLLESVFSFLRKLHTVLYSGHNNLHPHKKTALLCLLSLNKFMARKMFHEETNLGSIYWMAIKKSVPMSIKLREASSVFTQEFGSNRRQKFQKTSKNVLFVISHCIPYTYITDASPWFSFLTFTHHSRWLIVWYIGCNIQDMTNWFTMVIGIIPKKSPSSSPVSHCFCGKAKCLKLSSHEVRCRSRKGHDKTWINESPWVGHAHLWTT